MFSTITVGKSPNSLTVKLVAGRADSSSGSRSKGTTRTARSGTATLGISGRDPGFKADLGACIHESNEVILVGCGDPTKLDATGMRLLGGRLIRFLDHRAPAAVSLNMDAMEASSQPRAVLVQALAEGMGIANWRFDAHDGSASKRAKRLGSLRVGLSRKSDTVAFSRGMAIAAGTNFARTLGATPPNICTPKHVAAQSLRLARASGLKCKVINESQARKLGMGAFLAVGQGSINKPCMIHLSYTPKRRTNRTKRLVLVGKTITFDTGGYSLKVNNGMKGMKYDKAGGMCVLGAMQAIAALKPNIEVHAVLAAAENMVSHNSYRPDDIVRASNGVTIEVTNTDAEGRLVLADALVWSCRTLKPTAILDFATLTGGVVTALGSHCCGYFCNDDSLRQQYEDAASASGEKAWRLPLWPEHRDQMRSQHADILNSSASRGAHPIQGAAFLSFFVPESVPWCHVDIAGVANSESGFDGNPAGPTGFGVRTIVALATALA